MGQQRSRRTSTVDPAVRRRASELEQSMGLPPGLAVRVARGDLELNEVIKRMAVRDQAETLMRRHALEKALATQVALGMADLDAVLQRRRMQEHLDRFRNRSALDDAAASGAEVVLHVLGGALIRAILTAVDPYRFRWRSPEGAEEAEAHKLTVKLVHAAADRKAVRKVLRSDPALRAQGRAPSERPQDRYGCSNRRLFTLLDAATPVQVTTVEGDVLAGKLVWISRFEFGLQLKGGAEVAFMRHALADLRGVE